MDEKGLVYKEFGKVLPNMVWAAVAVQSTHQLCGQNWTDISVFTELMEKSSIYHIIEHSCT